MSANATSTVDSGSFNLFVYGQGNGTTTFNLPNDPAGRALGFAGSGSGLTARSINTQAGTETHTLTLHEIPAHSHTTPQTVSISQGLGSNTPATDTTGTTQSTGSAGGGGSHNNISPVAFLGYAYIYAGAQ